MRAASPAHDLGDGWTASAGARNDAFARRAGYACAARLAAELKREIDERPTVVILAQLVRRSMPDARRVDNAARVERRGERIASTSIQTNSSGCSALAPMRGVFPREAKQRGYFVVGRLAQDMRAPAERRGGLSGGADRMAGVELAIAKGALAIFPRLPPRDGAEREQKAARRKQIRVASKLARALQRMVERRVVIERGRVRAHIARSAE